MSLQVASKNGIAQRKAAKNPVQRVWTNDDFRRFYQECQMKAGSFEDVKSNYPYSLFLTRNEEAWKKIVARIVEMQGNHCEMEDDPKYGGLCMKEVMDENGKVTGYAWKEGHTQDMLDADYKALMSEPATEMII